MESAAVHHDPQHLNSTGCVIRVSEGKGRGVYASKPIPRDSTIEISPVLFFSKSEYEDHGKHTVLNHYTFVWPDGRMALALGLGSLFNHSDPPNVSFKLDTSTDSIRYITTRDIQTGEELCIFYGHKLWFTPVGGVTEENDVRTTYEDPHDGWGGLSIVEFDEQSITSVNPFAEGNAEEPLVEGDLPFMRYKLPPEEETPETVRTIQAWVVDIPDQRLITTILKWLKQVNLDSAELAHLKRIRKQNGTTTFLIASQAAFPLDPPRLPEHLDLLSPYLHIVPASSALTPTQLNLKTVLWPTMFTPRRKDEQERWSRGKAAWAWQAMQRTVQAAVEAIHNGEYPIAAHVPTPYEEPSCKNNADGIPSREAPKEFVAHDTRKSTQHPLRHAVINTIRKVADSAGSTSSIYNDKAESDASISQGESDGRVTPLQNGTNYLLTSLTLFTTHEPCVMCSMALLHSRVKEVIYLYPMPKTGACGSITCLPTLKGVNHRYSIARWKPDDQISSLIVSIAKKKYSRVTTSVDDHGVLHIDTKIDA